MTKVINILGAPGVGKSTYAAELFAKMKQNGLSCELVQEFAKEMVYADNEKLRQDQLIVLAEQYRRTFVLDGKIDYIITDSPLLLSIIYNNLTPNPYPKESFNQVCVNAFNRFDNINILLTHQQNRAYEQNGRVQNLTQSLQIQKQIISVVYQNGLKCCTNPEINRVVAALNKQNKKSALEAETGCR